MTALPTKTRQIAHIASADANTVNRLAKILDALPFLRFVVWLTRPFPVDKTKQVVKILSENGTSTDNRAEKLMGVFAGHEWHCYRTAIKCTKERPLVLQYWFNCNFTFQLRRMNISGNFAKKSCWTNCRNFLILSESKWTFELRWSTKVEQKTIKEKLNDMLTERRWTTTMDTKSWVGIEGLVYKMAPPRPSSRGSSSIRRVIKKPSGRRRRRWACRHRRPPCLLSDPSKAVGTETSSAKRASRSVKRISTASSYPARYLNRLA